MMHYWFYNGFGPVGALGAAMMVFWWLLLIVAIVFLVRWVRGDYPHRRSGRFHGDPAMDLLRERFAKGEIDKKEFEERRAELERE